MNSTALRLRRFRLNVSDLNRAIDFYCNALGFETAGESEQSNFYRTLLGCGGAKNSTILLRLGAEELELAAYDPPGAEYPPNSTASDLWFQHFAIVTRDMAAAYRRLMTYDPAPITNGGPQQLPPSSGGVMAYKFRDPDGHPLELIQFPPSNLSWNYGPATLTIGIDHSAISVQDAKRSIAFYRALGFQVSSRQINRGREQDRLDGLFKTEVDVVALQSAAKTAPHLELLCYNASENRACVSTRRLNDLADTKIIVQVDDLASFLKPLRLISNDTSIVDLSQNTSITMVRDPDGHGLVFVEAIQ